MKKNRTGNFDLPFLLDEIETLYQQYAYIILKEFTEAYKKELPKQVMRELECLLAYAKKNFMYSLEDYIFQLSKDYRRKENK